MKNIFKGKIGTILILSVTIVLAGIAIFTALRLYQLGNQPVAPNVPSSLPKAQEVVTGTCSLSFTISSVTPTPTPTPTPTTTGVPNNCGGTCGSSYNCNGGLYCNTSVNNLNGAQVTGVCRNPSWPDQVDCKPPGSTPTPTITATPVRTGQTTRPTTTPTAPSLPQAGTDWPTIAGAGIGILVIIGSLLLAL